MKFVVKPWRRFRALRDKTVDQRFLGALAHEAEDQFKIGLATRKSGIWYPNLPRRSSRAGEYPANQSGELRASISSTFNDKSATVGSNAKHSIFLRLGTSKMGRRKMAPDALDDAVPKVRKLLKGFVRWDR